MKLKIDNKTGQGVLTVNATGGKQTKSINVPLVGLHQWYPFNINYSYQYSDSKKYIYLIEETGYIGDKLYGVDILRRTPPLEESNKVMSHKKVKERNEYIIGQAKTLSVPYITGVFTLAEIQEGFNTIKGTLEVIKDGLERRYKRVTDDPIESSAVTSEQWDMVVYSVVRSPERAFMEELGEMYIMLSIMRKMVEGG